MTESASSITRFPELAELAALRDNGWQFRLLHDDNGELVCVACSRNHGAHTDAVFVFDRTHVVASRVLTEEHGGVVWLKDGTDLVEVVRELVNLPAPGEPGAPSLVIRGSALWSP
ncbi:hypothetical protein [Actinokineospora xionganensis]|uniref:Uncharacterized protein n=1 Tax=Actinokineospora xionganensis TaxID=2684470 RepID=A0ABR7LCX7_9PSEU|nr:hypothetical protein [Actinokineospora xionganensis]MBC6450540.1 hypothetical protein [Actinokineospora xionganensis]